MASERVWKKPDFDHAMTRISEGLRKGFRSFLDRTTVANEKTKRAYWTGMYVRNISMCMHKYTGVANLSYICACIHMLGLPVYFKT